MSDLAILQWMIIGSAIVLAMVLTGAIGILLWGISWILHGLRAELRAHISALPIDNRREPPPSAAERQGR